MAQAVLVGKVGLPNDFRSLEKIEKAVEPVRDQYVTSAWPVCDQYVTSAWPVCDQYVTSVWKNQKKSDNIWKNRRKKSFWKKLQR